MTVDEVMAHGKRYSQTFKKGYGLWVEDAKAMSLKTVLKLLLKKYAPKSIELVAKAITADQAAFEGSIDEPTAVYVDNDGSKAKADMSDFVEAEEVENTQAEEDKDNTIS